MLDEVLENRSGDYHYDKGTPEDIADSRKTVEWLETPKGRRVMRTSIIPALERAGVVPEGSALAYREPNPIAAFFRRLLGTRGPRQSWSSEEMSASDGDDAASSHSASSYGHTTSGTLPQSYMGGHGYGDSPKG